MIKILFVRSERASLPEIDAYINFFNKDDRFLAHDSTKTNHPYSFFDVIWEFKGVGGCKKKGKQKIVHEYASLSTGNFPKFKNKIKSLFNRTPDLRVFLNKDVHKELSFITNTPVCYRDMGIQNYFFSDIIIKKSNKKYDFVYIGEITKEREIDRLLGHLVEKNENTILLIGKYDLELFDKFKDSSLIEFQGIVPHKQVPQLASQAKYAINFIPNKYPYNLQTSTKLLEYLAMDLKVITTDYEWIRDFEASNKSNFYKIDIEDLCLNLKIIEEQNYVNNINIIDYSWEKVLNHSNIKKQILDLFEK